MTRASKPNSQPNLYVGSYFEDFPREEGQLKISTSMATKRIGTRRLQHS